MGLQYNDRVAIYQQRLIDYNFALPNYGVDGLFWDETLESATQQLLELKYFRDRYNGGKQLDVEFDIPIIEESEEDDGSRPPHSAHFSYKETFCSDGTEPPEEYWDNIQMLMDILEEPRVKLGSSIYPKWYRTIEYDIKRRYTSDWNNKSMHYLGGAADLFCSSTSNLIKLGDILYPMYKSRIIRGMACDRNFIHVDLRGLIPYKNNDYFNCYESDVSTYEQWKTKRLSGK